MCLSHMPYINLVFCSSCHVVERSYWKQNSSNEIEKNSSDSNEFENEIENDIENIIQMKLKKKSNEIENNLENKIQMKLKKSNKI
jgi:hypothetical protein